MSRALLVARLEIRLATDRISEFPVGFSRGPGMGE